MNGVSQPDGQRHSPIPPHGRISLPAACVALYLTVVLVLFVTIRHRDDGIFTYTLDDPYIHLALAQSLAHGHYGINPGEPSSPSSSVVWPLLLVPFASRPWNVYAPLLWNLLFCATAAWLIGRTVDRLAFEGLDPAPARLKWPTRFALAAALMLIANLAGLTFIGMEHGLQVLLAIACAAGMAEVFAGRPMPAWALGAAILGTVVRYEAFALVAAVAITLYGQRRIRAAWTVVGLSLIGPALFSVFLISRGLPALPSSVLVKASVYSFHGGVVFTAIATMMQSIYLGIHEATWWEQLGVALLLAYLTWREQQRSRRFVLAGALCVALLQLAIGKFNWFNRYEVYALIFTITIAAAALIETTRLARGWLAGCLFALGIPYTIGLYEIPAAAANIYQQQYQMHRFLAGFSGPVIAVNDLGLVSYNRPAGLYVLDLWGLASPEASRQARKDAGWLEAITEAHAARLAIIYPYWYPDGAPDDWQPLGTMCITGRRISIGDKCVVFYSTTIGDAAALQPEVTAFSRTLPATVKMTLGKDTTDDDNGH